MDRWIFEAIVGGMLGGAAGITAWEAKRWRRAYWDLAARFSDLMVDNVRLLTQIQRMRQNQNTGADSAGGNADSRSARAAPAFERLDDDGE